MEQFKQFKKTKYNGLLIDMEEGEEIDDFFCDRFLSSWQIDKPEYLNPNLHAKNGIVRGGSLEDLWKSMEKASNGGSSEWIEYPMNEMDENFRLIFKTDKEYIDESELMNHVRRFIEKINRPLLNMSGYFDWYCTVLYANHCAGGFLSRPALDQDACLEFPSAIYGRSNLTVYTRPLNGRYELHEDVVGVIVSRSYSSLGTPETIDQDSLAARMWCSGIGSGCSHFFALSRNGMKIVWSEIDHTYKPLSNSGPQERRILYQWPPENLMSDFRIPEHRVVFFRYLFCLAKIQSKNYEEGRRMDESTREKLHNEALQEPRISRTSANEDEKFSDIFKPQVRLWLAKGPEGPDTDLLLSQIDWCKSNMFFIDTIAKEGRDMFADWFPFFQDKRQQNH